MLQNLASQTFVLTASQKKPIGKNTKEEKKKRIWILPLKEKTSSFNFPSRTNQLTETTTKKETEKYHGKSK